MSVFNDPESVKDQLNLPAVVKYSFVGPSTPEYHAKVEEIIVRVVGEQHIRSRQMKESSGGKYTAYRFEVYHDLFEDVESVYEQVAALEGTRFVI